MSAFTRLQDGEARPPHAWLAELRPAERAPADRPFVFLNMVASVDGRAAVTSSARGLGSPADTLLLGELRALADAVLIGTGTLRAEGYGVLVRDAGRRARRRDAGLPDTPLAVLCSRALDLPWDAGLFAAADQPVLAYTESAHAAPELAAPVELARLAQASVPALLADLRARGVRALLCEGGPTLNRSLLAAGAVDELFLTLSPQLTGAPDAPRIVEGGALPEAVGLERVWALAAEGDLFLRYRVVIRRTG